MNATQQKQLLSAIKTHADELSAWLKRSTPLDDEDGFLSVEDARLVDFTPLKSWLRVVRVCDEIQNSN